ncbi:MAG TPA: ABC transporter permease [Thermoanaerobaculia bacterium]|nr:ABC transporter permease [Thermoanaerobaculia bacterium]
MKQIAIGALAAIAAVVLLALSGAAFGHAPGALLSTLVSGSIGSPFALRGTIIKSIPLLLTGLSVAIAFRAGVWNIGAEGQFIVGGLACFLGAPFGFVAALAASVLAGALWALAASLLRFWRNAPEVLTTILLNFVAIHLLGYAVNGPMQEAKKQYPQTDAATIALSTAAEVVIAVAVCIAAWILLYRTQEGLRLRATGFNPFAALWAGVNVNAQIARAMAISGAMAGLAGGLELLAVTHRLFERFAAGYGYSGIAVALLAQLHPLATMLSAVFFGALETGAGELQRASGVSSTVATFGEAVVILVLIAFGSFRARD